MTGNRLGSFQTHSLVEPWPPADPIDDRIPLLGFEIGPTQS